MADINLGVGNLNTLGSELLQDGGQAGGGTDLTDDEVALETDTVDLDASSLDEVDNSQSGGQLGTGEFDGIIVVVELGGGVGSGGGGEGDGDVVLSDGLVKDVVTVGSITVVRQGLVHHVPGVAFTLVVSHFVGDVGGHGRREGVIGPCVGGDPGWQLVVPDQVVAAHDLAVVLSKVDNDITLGVIEAALGRLSVIPLLGVSGSDLTELVGITQDGCVVGIGKFAVVCSRSEVPLDTVSYARNLGRLSLSLSLRRESSRGGLYPYFFPAAIASLFNWASAPAASASTARLEVKCIAKNLLQAGALKKKRERLCKE